jgi:NADH dehydrogenase FAD-containing subunit
MNNPLQRSVMRCVSRRRVTRRRARGGVLISGGGFGGAYVARQLGAGAATTISPSASLTFTALLLDAASGTLRLRHVEVPLRTLRAGFVLDPQPV